MARIVNVSGASQTHGSSSSPIALARVSPSSVSPMPESLARVYSPGSPVTPRSFASAQCKPAAPNRGTFPPAQLNWLGFIGSGFSPLLPGACEGLPKQIPLMGTRWLRRLVNTVEYNERPQARVLTVDAWLQVYPSVLAAEVAAGGGTAGQLVRRLRPQGWATNVLRQGCRPHSLGWRP